MERLSWELTTRLAKRRPTRVIALGAGNLWLPFFFVGSALAIVAGSVRRRITLLHLGDCALAPLGRLAKLFGVPVCVTIHGRDITFAHPLYRLWLKLFLREFDAYICVSGATRDAAVSYGVPTAQTRIIGNGTTALPVFTETRDANLLLFVGRLVPRKGLRWFVRSVLPDIVQRRPTVRLAVIGAGPERKAIQQAATAAGVADRIEWLGVLADVDREQWLHRATVFIAPNIRVAGEMEGYGIVAIEAAAAGCAVVAADIEGLREAIVDGEGGRLVPAEDAFAWVSAIGELLDHPIRASALGDRARAWARAERTWESVCDRYEAVFDAIK